MRHRIRVWGPAAAWASVLFILSTIPNPGGIARLPVSDKLVHAGLYLVFGVALAYGWVKTPKPVGHLLLLVIGTLYAASDEWHQMFVPGRSPDFTDWAADMVGLLVGYGTTVRVSGRNRAEDETPEGDDA